MVFEMHYNHNEFKVMMLNYFLKLQPILPQILNTLYFNRKLINHCSDTCKKVKNH